MKKILAVLLSLCIFSFAHAAPDPDRYLLTTSTLQKLKAINADAEKLKIKGLDDGKDEDDGGESVEDFAKAIDADPKAKAVVAKHGMTSMEFALAVHAVFAAGFYLAFEPSMDKKKAASLYASYPKERQANIELLRKNPQFMK